MYVRKWRRSRDNIHVCRKELIPDKGKEAQRVTYIYIYIKVKRMYYILPCIIIYIYIWAIPANLLISLTEYTVDCQIVNWPMTSRVTLPTLEILYWKIISRDNMIWGPEAYTIIVAYLTIKIVTLERVYLRNKLNRIGATLKSLREFNLSSKYSGRFDFRVILQ